MKLEFGKREPWYFYHHDYNPGDIVEIEKSGTFRHWLTHEVVETLPAGLRGLVVEVDYNSVTVEFDGREGVEEIIVFGTNNPFTLVRKGNYAAINNPDLYDRPLFDLDELS